MTSSRHAVVLLAAGQSRRLGQPKQLVPLAGEALVRRAARAALATDPAQALIVVGAHADQVWAAVADLPLVRVDCAGWAAGLSASLHAGLARLEPTVEAALFVLCDQPALETSHLRALVARWSEAPLRAVASGYAGTLGVPAVVPRTWFKDFETLTGDQGARDLLRARATRVEVVQAPALAADLDRPADLARMLRGPGVPTKNQ
jgi:CTP:molybdopterin cytidylyltransferase MocA